MDRKIKFRFWCKISEEMKHRIDFDTDPYSPLPLNSPNYVTMQYTGLEDKNGKEIWEGDIVEYEDLSDGIVIAGGEQPISRGVVKWHEQGRWTITDKDGYTIPTHITEVIGNKFENPELLEDN